MEWHSSSYLHSATNSMSSGTGQSLSDIVNNFQFVPIRQNKSVELDFNYIHIKPTKLRNTLWTYHEYVDDKIKTIQMQPIPT